MGGRKKSLTFSSPFCLSNLSEGSVSCGLLLSPWPLLSPLSLLSLLWNHAKSVSIPTIILFLIFRTLYSITLLSDAKETGCNLPPAYVKCLCTKQYQQQSQSIIYNILLSWFSTATLPGLVSFGKGSQRHNRDWRDGEEMFTTHSKISCSVSSSRKKRKEKVNRKVMKTHISLAVFITFQNKNIP